MAHVQRRSEDWKSLPWKQFQRNVFRLQKRIYQAMRRGDFKRVHSLQRLLLRSWSARCLAVRQVSQDNRGKRTPGVDGVASLTPKQRLAYARHLGKLSHKTDPVRRVYILKVNGELRPLGIPTMFHRALQALVKLALEPEWEVVFEPNSYAFRPGRCPQDAIGSIFNFIRLKPKFALDTDIEKCFDQIDHQALLRKLRTIRPVANLIRGWLKAAIVDNGMTIFPEAGTPQGGVISPLLANIALHGLETYLIEVCPHRNKPGIIRFADDFIVLHEDLDTVLFLKSHAEKWLTQMGLHLKPSKTRIVHTLLEHQDHKPGFDFLGFNIRQYPVGKHHTSTHRGKPGFKTIIKPSKKAQQRQIGKIKAVIRKHRGNNQAALISELNPIIRGWSNYYRTCSAKHVFGYIDYHVYRMLFRWAAYRHRNKNFGWCYRRYWRNLRRIDFSDGNSTLIKHKATKVYRHVKVKGHKSPFDGDWVYWSARLGREPSKPKRVVKLLKRQDGKCLYCKLRFMTDNIIEVHHRNGDRVDNRYLNLALLHGHCHDQVHANAVCL